MSIATRAGAKRPKGKKNPRDRAHGYLYITPLVRKVIKQVLRSNPQDYNNIMLCMGGFWLGIFAFLRAGKLTTNEKFDNHTNPSILKVNIKKSKTDQSREGISLYVGRTGNELCPVAPIYAPPFSLQVECSRPTRYYQGRQTPN